MCVYVYIYMYTYCWWFRNPAPPGMHKTCQLVQDFFHQQYIYVYICTYFSLGWSDLHQSKMEQWKANSSFVELKHGVIIIPTQTKRYCKGNPSKLQYICIVWMTPVKEMQEFWNQIKKKTECHDYWTKLSLTLPRARRSKGRSNKVRRKCDLIRTHSSVASRLLTSPYYTMVGEKTCSNHQLQ